MYHTCSHRVRNYIMCLLSPILGTEQYCLKTWNTETVGDLSLVNFALVIFYVHGEGILTGFSQSCDNASAFSNLLVLEMVLIKWHGGRIEFVHINLERVRIKAKSVLFVVGCISCVMKSHWLQLWWMLCTVNSHVNFSFKRAHDLEWEECSLTPAGDELFSFPVFIVASH